MFCKKCGSEVASTYKLCPQCGEKDFSHTRVTATPQPVMPQPSAPFPNALSSLGKSSKNNLVLAVVGGVVVLAIALFGIKTWENAKAEAEVKKQEQLVRIEIDRKRKEMELELERKRLEEEAVLNQERARVAEQEARESQERRERVASVRDALQAIEFYARPSLTKEGTKVLQINNIRGVSVSFDLKCCTNGNECKTMPVSIGPRSTAEIGFLEGWPGNFVSGERCEIRFQDDVIRTVQIK